MEIVKSDYIKDLIFDNNYLYDTPNYINDYYLYYLTELEEKELLSTINLVTFPSLQSGDSVYFDDSVTFPRNLCTTLGQGLKRTIKKDKATKILVNKNKSFSKDNYAEYLKFGYYVKLSNQYSVIFFIPDSNIIELGLSEDKVEKLIGSELNRGFLLNKSIPISYLDLIKESGSILTPSTELIKYINKSLPNLTESNKENILGLVSNNQEQLKLAFNTLIGFNTSDIIWDFIFKLAQLDNIDNNLKNTVNFKYIVSILGYTLKDYQSIVYRYRYYYDSCFEILSSIYHSDLISEDQRKKIWEYFDKNITGQGDNTHYHYTQDDLDKFDKYNIPRPQTNDQV